MNRLLQLLSGWQEGRCLPDLWRVIESPGESPLEAVAADWLAQLAVPRTPVQALRELVDRGAFDAAEYLLSALDLGSAETNEWLHQLEVERTRARVGIEEELDRLLARCGGESCPVPDLETRREEIVNLATADWEAAERCRRKLADEVRRWEDELGTELLADLATRCGELADDPRTAAWRRRVERAVDARHFDLARDALLRGPGEDLGSTWPPLPPPPPPWDFGYASPREVCSWLRHAGEARVDFFANWGPLEDDETASELIESLDALLSPGTSETEVRRFLASLERCLDVSPRAERPVERMAAGFRSVLRGLYHPAMPMFHPLRYPDGVPIALVVGEAPSAPATAPAAAEKPPDAPLVFTDALLPLADGVAELRPEDLFRLLPQPSQRKLHLLRFVGSQIKLDEALGGPEVGHSPADLNPLAFDAIRRFAEEILYLHGLSPSGEDVLDRIAHIAGGRPAVLLLLLRELFSQYERAGRTRRYPITDHDLDNALASDGFREPAAALLLAPVARDPGLKCLLAACILETQETHESHAGIAASDVQLWLSLLGLDPGEAEVAEGLERLRELGIVERHERPGHLHLVRGTMSLLVHHFLARPMAYLEAERHRRELR